MNSWLAALGVVISVGFSSQHGRASELDQSRIVHMRDVCGNCRLERFTQCGDFLEGPAFDKAGNLWMSSLRSGDIHKVTPDGQCATVANTGGSPRGLEFHRDGACSVRMPTSASSYST